MLERFLSYIKIDTQSDESSSTSPSTQKQFDLAKQLVKELEELGLVDISLDQNGYVMATLPANTEKQLPKVGLIAHMDTSPDMSGENVNPKIWENYDGKDLVLSSGISISVEEYPFLKNYKGQTLITTDGTTLLGADDKAGIAIIMSVLENLKKSPQIKHGEIGVCFTPDEEIGRGADFFDVEKFACDFAYTIDGGEIGELEYESFNAASAVIRFQGKNVHPGTAKNVMKNSMEIAADFVMRFPEEEKPQTTEGYEGFFHLTDFNGKVEDTVIKFIIRDFDRENFEKRKNRMKELVEEFRQSYGIEIELDLRDQYYNMKEKIEPCIEIVDIAARAYEKNGIKPNIKPIRGGTDGSRLSFMGLPTPNIFTGGHNYHGKSELIPLESMEKARDILLTMVQDIVAKY